MTYLALYLWLGGFLSMWASTGFSRAPIACLFWPVVAPVVIAGAILDLMLGDGL